MRKKLLFIILILLLAACSRSTKYRTVISKSYYVDGREGHLMMPHGLCRYYDSDGFTFQDSCKFYFVGDSLKPRR